MFNIKFNTKPPKIYQVRKQVSRFLVWLAGKINPKCPYRYSYFLEETMKAQMDAVTYGEGCIEIKHKPYKEKVSESPSKYRKAINFLIELSKGNDGYLTATSIKCRKFLLEIGERETMVEALKKQDSF